MSGGYVCVTDTGAVHAHMFMPCTFSIVFPTMDLLITFILTAFILFGLRDMDTFGFLNASCDILTKWLYELKGLLCSIASVHRVDVPPKWYKDVQTRRSSP